MKIKRGYLVYDGGKDSEVIWVAPHCGASIETPTSRDDNSDTVASLCWLKVGGKLVISTLPRKRAFGIDFNREPPPPGKALRYYDWFMNNEKPEVLKDYRKKYAWVARNKQDHTKRRRIYRSFWKEVGERGKTVVFVHRKFTRLKNFPSLMDLIAYRGYGFNVGMLRDAAKDVNKKYAPFMKSVSGNYKDAILLEQQRAVDRVLAIYSTFDLSRISVEYKQHIEEDIKIIKRFAEPAKAKRLQKHFTPRNFMSCVKSALKKAGDPCITVESIFSGVNLPSKRSLFRKANVIEVESNSFLNYWYPQMASKMLLDIVNRIKPMTKLTQYLSEY